MSPEAFNRLVPIKEMERVLLAVVTAPLHLNLKHYKCFYWYWLVVYLGDARFPFHYNFTNLPHPCPQKDKKTKTGNLPKKARTSGHCL